MPGQTLFGFSAAVPSDNQPYYFNLFGGAATLATPNGLATPMPGAGTIKGVCMQLDVNNVGQNCQVTLFNMTAGGSQITFPISAPNQQGFDNVQTVTFVQGDLIVAQLTNGIGSGSTFLSIAGLITFS